MKIRLEKEWMSAVNDTTPFSGARNSLNETKNQLLRVCPNKRRTNLKRVAFILTGKYIFSALELIRNKEQSNINMALKIIVMISYFS